ncbi:hypothetical protein BU23DRAFT_444504 [Bimuria novae-zelandiae CBS 107.79]|uniref:Sin3-associated polypeptide Sap18 n=1 Tax=Bimuria novae-zelandiae CBS 107.79 TaxID=1447943 RepID=A0A6A5VSM6_9PLEO|nr:hypothetical protein BU23DRAFT_444504 [Bimuria novae-zelandiae CBS 107.79]
MAIDRQTTTPFLLRLFYKTSAFHDPESFDPAHRLPPNLQIYTWPSCTLRELSTLLLTTLPNLLPQPYAGARIAFRLVYGDMNGPQRPGSPPRFMSRELGSVVVGANSAARGEEDRDGEGEGDGAKADVSEALEQLDGEPEKTLSDAKFVIGDYVSCAIFAPLADGSVAPAPPPPTMPARGGPPPSDTYGGRGGREYANGYGGRGGQDGFGRGRGRGGRFEDRRDFGGVPSGEWRRGEAPPEREPGYGWRGGREGGRGRGRGRW